MPKVIFSAAPPEAEPKTIRLYDRLAMYAMMELQGKDIDTALEQIRLHMAELALNATTELQLDVNREGRYVHLYPGGLSDPLHGHIEFDTRSGSVFGHDYGTAVSQRRK